MTVTLYTGKSRVKEIADKCREIGLKVDIEGKEYIYLDIKLSEIKDCFSPRQWTIFSLQKMNVSLPCLLS